MMKRPDTSVDLQPTLTMPDRRLDGAGREPVPEMAGGYRILREAGRGGMGVVYEAVQLEPPRPVALKMLLPDQRTSAAAVARFRTEVRVAAKLHHTNIVPVLATIGGTDGPTAYAMPYIRGESLAAVLRAIRQVGNLDAPSTVAARVAALARTDRPGYVRGAVEWMRQASEAVAAAHAAGAVHRDVKPGNLLLEFDRTGRPHVWLHDFGLAVQEADPDTEVDAIRIGTPGYRSPEQVSGEPAALRPTTDVYSLGVTLAELLTFASPSEGRPVEVGREIPSELRRAIAKATAALPADRYPSAEGLADDLARFLAGFPVRAGRPRWYRDAALWAGRHRRSLLAAGTATVVASAVATALLAAAYSAERSARRAATVARKAVAANTLAVDDILYATPGRLDAERKMLEEAVRVQELHLEVEPDDFFATRHLAHASWRLGRVYSRLERRDEAVASVRRAVVRYRAVAAAEPENPLHRLDEARSLSILAAAYRIGSNPDAAAAHAADFEALRTVENLLKRFPTDLRVRDAAATYTAQFASSLLQDGRASEAEQLYRRAIDESGRCAKSRPDLWRLASPEMGARMRLAQMIATRGRLGEALAENAVALELCNGLLARSAPQAGDADRLELLSFRLARAELLENRAAWTVAAGLDATQASSDLDEIVRFVATEHPDFPRNPLEAPHVRAWMAYRLGRPNAAGVAGREYETMLRAGPPNLARSVQLSRYYADGPGERDARRAEAEARDALRYGSAHPLAVHALAAALYRLERFDEAETELMRIAAAPQFRTTCLIRAALAARRGNRDEARRLFAEASESNLPCEHCTPEWEAEVRRTIASVEK